MVEQQAVGARTGRLDHPQTIEAYDAAPMGLKEDLRVELLCKRRERAIDREPIVSGDGPHELVARLEVDYVPKVDDHIGVLATDGESLQRDRLARWVGALCRYAFKRSSQAFEADWLEEVVGDLRFETANHAVVVRRDDHDSQVGMALPKLIG